MLSELRSAPRRLSIEDPIRSVVRMPFLFSNIHVGSWDRCGARAARRESLPSVARRTQGGRREEAIVELEAGVLEEALKEDRSGSSGPD